MTLRVHPISIPTPFPIGAVNAYLLPDDPVTLIDAGPKTEQARAALERGFEAAGVPLHGLERIILTHGHMDHFGLAASLGAEVGASIFAHPDDAPKFAADESIIEPLLQFLRRHGAPDLAAAAVGEALRAHRRLLDPLPSFHHLTDGTRLRQGDAVMEVLHTPGHSAGHICLISAGTLMAGDVLLEEVSANPVLEFGPDGRRHHTLAQLIASLRRLDTLNPSEVFPGHGAPFGPARPRIAALLAHHAQRQQQVLAQLTDTPQTAFDLAQALFPGTDPMNLLLALSEVIGHLDLLIAEERAVEIVQHAQAGYRRGSRPQS